MRSCYKALAALCSLTLSVNTGCSGNVASSDMSGESSATALPTGESSDRVTSTVLNKASEKDLAPSSDCESAVAFTSDGAQCMGSGVSADGNVVTITSAGSYSVSGSCNDGQLVIDCGKDDDVFIVLNGLDLTCSSGPAILCENADKLTITLNKNTQNSLSDGTGYSSEQADDTGAALFSRDTLVINGDGSLTVNGAYKDGIKSKDGLKLCGGTISVTAVEDGIIGKDYLLAAAGSITVNSGADGLKSTNSGDAEKGYVNITGGDLTIISGNDGIQAETVLNISDGDINITSGGGSAAVEHTSAKENDFGKGHFRDFSTDGTGGFDFSDLTNSSGESAESMKAVKAGTSVTMTGGRLTADSADDAIHSNGDVNISGGVLTLSTGDDGIHADGLLVVEAGEINITESYEGLEAPGMEISGGTVSLVAFDDGLNASGSSADVGFTPYITISGGSVTANANGDGIDSNGTISMSGGILVVFGPTDNANGAIDYEQSFALSGGTLIALGSKGMGQAPSTLSQPCISIFSSAKADTTIEVRDQDGNAILSTITPKECTSLIFSSPDLVSGSEYSVYSDEVLLATVTVTDGVSGGGASGTGNGTWNRDGDTPWGGGFGKPGRNDGKEPPASPDGTPPMNNGDTGTAA
ncbi:MAG: carbohydrate-binding domain-containing protein [Oscillospiraceae bacterium]|nr:carbohydrate-binding domain-containing protein [Oscillospiraceae bacterium]